MGELPMNGKLYEVIDQTAKRTAEDIVKELKKQNLIVNGKQSPFQKTETLLFNYNNFKAAIEDKEEQIEEIRQYGTRKHTSFGGAGNTGFVEIKSELEKAEDKIESIELSMQITKNYIRIIDSAVNTLKDDPYCEIIPMRYFEGKSREEIAAELNCDASTVTRNKNRMINILQIRLFSDQVIAELFSF